MSPRTSPAVVQLSTLPEFLRSATVGELVAASLDEHAATILRAANPDGHADALTEAQAGIYRNAAQQTRTFIAPTSSTNGQA